MDKDKLSSNSLAALGKKIRAARRGREWSLKLLGEKCNCTANTICRIEKGHGVHFSVLEAICKELEITSVELL